MSAAGRRLLRVWARALVGTGLPGLVDRAILRRHFRARPRAPRTHLILAAPGNGNVGDQALLEALLENIEGPVALIVSVADQLRLPEELRTRTEVLEIPHLIYGEGADHRSSIARFGSALAGASRLSIVGADVLDGTYSLPASVRRSNLAAAAAGMGVDTRVVGFSWSDRPRAAARRALARAARSGAQMLVRDPCSAMRVRRHGIDRVVQVADVVFAARTVDRGAAAELLAGVTAPVALVNVSGLVADSVDQTEEYAAIVDALRCRGVHVVIVPHVIRDQGGDLAACATLAERVGPVGVSQVSTALTPAQVRGLTERATLTVTGRMHLAVMSLMHGVPAITMASQGKVEGLMQLFSTPELCIPPRPGFAVPVIDMLDRLLPGDSDTRRCIRRALPHVVALACRNTEDGLHSVELRAICVRSGKA